MIGVRLHPDLESRLNTLTKQTHRSKSFYVQRALEEFLDQYEDVLLATSRWKSFERGESSLISLEELDIQQSLKKS
jgi:RHH-type rel operon transcriptional repressor/antitoxin RelB